jgi:hypothetical protein
MEVEAARYIGAGLAVVALGGAARVWGVLFGNYLKRRGPQSGRCAKSGSAA